MGFGVKVRKARMKYGLTQDEVAKMVGITKGTYGHIERGRTSEWVGSSVKVKESGLFNPEVMRKKIGRIQRQRMRERDKYRIPNIPSFYERLNSLCDKDGKINVDSNHPMLQDLREAVGGERYMEKKAYNN